MSYVFDKVYGTIWTSVCCDLDKRSTKGQGQNDISCVQRRHPSELLTL